MNLQTISNKTIVKHRIRGRYYAGFINGKIGGTLYD